MNTYIKLQKILLNPKASEWMSHEWIYGGIDDEFFNGTNQFEQFLQDSFPRLKTRLLTRAEWRKIRKYVGPSHKRLFSPKYILEKRAKLHQYRSKRISLQELTTSDFDTIVDDCEESYASDFPTYALSPSTEDIQLCDTTSQIECDNGSDNFLFQLMVETSNCLSRKSDVLDQIKQLMKSVENGHNHLVLQSVKNIISRKLTVELYNLNTEILSNFEKLWNFDEVKTTLLFNSTTRIKADYQRTKCQLAIAQKIRQLQIETLHDYQMLSEVVESLLTFAYILTDSATHSLQTFTEIVTRELKKLKILCGDECALFELDWLPQLLSIFNKAVEIRGDGEK